MTPIHSRGIILNFFCLFVGLFIQRSLEFNNQITDNPINLGYIQKSTRNYKRTQNQPTNFLRSQNKENGIDITSNIESNHQIDLEFAKVLLKEQNLSITGLYYLPSCPFCKRVLKVYEALDEKQKFSLKNLKDSNPDTGQLYLNELLSITPNVKQVPALEIDHSYILRESSDIISLLNELINEKPSQKKNTISTKLSSSTPKTNSDYTSSDTSPDNVLSPGKSVINTWTDEQNLSDSSNTIIEPSNSTSSTIYEEDASMINLDDPYLSESLPMKPSNFSKTHSNVIDAAYKTDPVIPKMVFVGNITWEAVTEDLEKCMSLAGNVTNVSFIYNRFGRHKGCAVVTYNSPQEATEAIKILNNTYFKGRKINVQAYARFPRSNSLPHSDYPRQIPSYSQNNNHLRQFHKHSDSELPYYVNNFKRLNNNLQSGHVANNVLFVWNLPNEFLKNDLEKLFNNTGYIRQSHIVPLADIHTNRLGIVMFSSEQDALKAQRRYDKKTINGQNIEVSMATPNQNFHNYSRPPYSPNKGRFPRYYSGTNQTNNSVESHFDGATVDPEFERIVDSIVTR